MPDRYIMLLLAAVGCATCTTGSGEPVAQDAGTDCPDLAALQGDACSGGGTCDYPLAIHAECRNPCQVGCRAGSGWVPRAVRTRCEHGAWQRVALLDTGPMCPLEDSCVCVVGGRGGSTAHAGTSGNPGVTDLSDAGS